MIIDQNDITLCGQCNWHKLWDPGSNPYTTLCLKLEIDGAQNVFVDISIKEKQITGNYLKITMDKLSKGGTYVILKGSIVKKKVKGQEVSSIKANLNNLSVQSGNRAPLNFAFISGKVTQTSPELFTINSSYKNPLKGETLERSIQVIHKLNETQLEKITKAFKTLVTGRIVDQDGIKVLATAIYPE